MAEPKYIFNHKTLSYEKYQPGWRQYMMRVISYLLSTAAFAVVIVVVAFNFLGSPKERMLQRELSFAKLQYKILSDRLSGMEDLLAEMQERDDNIYRVIFEAEPIPQSVRRAGYGGVDRYDKLTGYRNSEIIMDVAKRIDQVASQLYVQSKSYDEVFEMAHNKAAMLSAIPAIQPVKNTDLKRISSYFGIRTDPFYKVNKFHHGVDFSAPVGTEVFATGDGKVVSVSKSKWGYGNTVVIDHGFGYETKYSHLHEFKVRKGERVNRGQLIATMGNTGKSTAPHLHYEVHKNGRPVNPIHFFFNDLTPEQYELVLELSALPTQSMD
ncbi:MAG: M23 family metallopeptidase [Bacteroidetes bacterium]|nr:M23 family metallopeptidase [Bacteroidota bacterium]MBU1579875.1 M23 family metallopeptidase [Bacteroidota bacterium]MBU2465311.1 M23 family metallopeptidase [Bacteroidota bacterium]MBU2557853.1 M23 family metallopeptidase [Bacteroidota bacterium]